MLYFLQHFYHFFTSVILLFYKKSVKNLLCFFKKYAIIEVASGKAGRILTI